MNAPKVIYAYREDRLGARLLNLLATWRIGRKLGIQTVVVWPPPIRGQEHLYGDEYDVRHLFDWEGMRAAGLAGDISFGSNDEAKALCQPVSAAIKGKAPVITVETLFGSGEKTAYGGKPMLLLKGENRDDAFAEIQELAATLLPAEPIARRLAELTTAINLPERVAVHARLGDIGTEIARMSSAKRVERIRLPGFLQYVRYAMTKSAPVEAYLRILKTNAASILLATDTPSLVAAFVAGLGADIARFEQFEPLVPAVAQDFLELLAIARAKTLIAAHSNFSQCATYFGANKIDVTETVSSAEYVGYVKSLMNCRNDAVRELLYREIDAWVGKRDQGVLEKKMRGARRRSRADAAERRPADARAP